MYVLGLCSIRFLSGPCAELFDLQSESVAGTEYRH